MTGRYYLQVRPCPVGVNTETTKCPVFVLDSTCGDFSSDQSMKIKDGWMMLLCSVLSVLLLWLPQPPSAWGAEVYILSGTHVSRSYLPVLIRTYFLWNIASTDTRGVQMQAVTGRWQTHRMKAELLVLVVSLLCWTEAEGETLHDNFTKVNDDNRHFNYKQLV